LSPPASAPSDPAATTTAAEDDRLRANAERVATSLSSLAATDERFADSAFLSLMRAMAEGRAGVRGGTVVGAGGASSRGAADADAAAPSPPLFPPEPAVDPRDLPVYPDDADAADAGLDLGGFDAEFGDGTFDPLAGEGPAVAEVRARLRAMEGLWRTALAGGAGDGEGGGGGGGDVVGADNIGAILAAARGAVVAAEEAGLTGRELLGAFAGDDGGLQKGSPPSSSSSAAPGHPAPVPSVVDHFDREWSAERARILERAAAAAGGVEGGGGGGGGFGGGGIPAEVLAALREEERLMGLVEAAWDEAAAAGRMAPEGRATLAPRSSSSTRARPTRGTWTASTPSGPSSRTRTWMMMRTGPRLRPPPPPPPRTPSTPPSPAASASSPGAGCRRPRSEVEGSAGALVGAAEGGGVGVARG
jgi:hypothetical protein